MRKIYKGLAGALLLGLGSVPAMAGVDTFSIPATQEEFDTWVQVVPEGAERWKLVTDNGPDPYASVAGCVTDFGSYDIGQILLAPKEYNLKAGEKLKFRAQLSTSDYACDYRYVFIAYSDADTYVKGFRSSVYGGEDGALVWQDKAEVLDFVINEAGTYRCGVALMGKRNSSTTIDNPLFFLRSIEVEREVDGPAYAKWASLQPAKADPDGERAVTLSFTWPSKTKSGAALDNVGGMIYRSASSQFAYAGLVADITGVPGEDAVYVDCEENNPETCITEDEQYSYWIRTYTVVDGEKLLSDENPPMARTAWVGGDTDVLPLDPSKASLEPVEGGFKVNFVKEFVGANGGQVKASECKIKITRQRGADTPVVLVSDYQGESPYVDATVDQPGSYMYRLYVVYKGKETAECAVGPVYSGEPVNVPYSESLDTPESMSLFSIVSDGSYSWTYNENEACAEFLPSEYISCKSNMMTPPLKLVKNTKYQISFKSWVDEVEGNAVVRQVSVTYGTTPTFDGSNVRTVTVSKTAADKETYTCNLTPEEDGEYFIGFQSEYKGTSKVYVDDIKVVETSRIPGAVTDFTVTPDQSGANKAVVAFRLPSVTSGGSQLDKISKVLVYRNNEETGSAAINFTPENIAPGAQVSFTDEVAQTGYYSYMVYTMRDKDLSPMFQSESFWIGADTPGAASNAVASVEGNVLTLSWDAASSTHGGVVPGFAYEVYRRGAGQAEPEMVAETTDLSYVDSATDALEYNLYTYSVLARGNDAASVAVAAEPVLLGDHASLPLNPDFMNEEAFLAWELSGADHDGCNLNFVDFGDGAGMFVVTPPFMAPEVSETPALEIALGISNDVTGEMVSGEIKVYAVALETAKVARDAEPVETLLATVEVNGDTPALVEKDNLLLPAKGKYRVKIASDTEGLTLTSIKVDADTSTVGVAGISSESDDAVYFTVDGLRVEKPSVPGIYIKVEGSKSTRILVR